jgi:hypothetical protein
MIRYQTDNNAKGIVDTKSFRKKSSASMGTIHACGSTSQRRNWEGIMRDSDDDRTSDIKESREI